MHHERTGETHAPTWAVIGLFPEIASSGAQPSTYAVPLAATLAGTLVEPGFWSSFDGCLTSKPVHRQGDKVPETRIRQTVLQESPMPSALPLLTWGFDQLTGMAQPEPKASSADAPQGATASAVSREGPMPSPSPQILLPEMAFAARLVPRNSELLARSVATATPVPAAPGLSLTQAEPTDLCLPLNIESIGSGAREAQSPLPVAVVLPHTSTVGKSELSKQAEVPSDASKSCGSEEAPVSHDVSHSPQAIKPVTADLGQPARENLEDRAMPKLPPGSSEEWPPAEKSVGAPKQIDSELTAPGVFTAAREMPRAVPRPPDVGARPDWELQPPVPMAHGVALRLTDAGSSVQIRMAERAGEIRVTVHASNPDLLNSLREELPDLAGRLRQSGFQTETWRPSKAEQGNSRHKSADDAPGSSGGGQGENRQNPQRRNQAHWAGKWDASWKPVEEDNA